MQADTGISTGELINEIRTEVQAQTDRVSPEAGYAAMASFAVVPDFGILDLENSSRFYRPVSTAILQPAFEVLIF